MAFWCFSSMGSLAGSLNIMNAAQCSPGSSDLQGRVGPKHVLEKPPAPCYLLCAFFSTSQVSLSAGIFQSTDAFEVHSEKSANICVVVVYLMITCFLHFLIWKLSLHAHFVAVFKSSEIFYVVSMESSMSVSPRKSSMSSLWSLLYFCSYSTLESLAKSAKMVMWIYKCMCRSKGVEFKYQATGLEFKYHMNFPTRKLESQFRYCKSHEYWNCNHETV